MKIKAKYLIFVTLIIVSNLGFLFLFTGLSLQPKIVDRAHQLQVHVEKNLERIAKESKDKSFIEFCKILETEAPQGKLYFTVANNESNIVFKTGVESTDAGKIRAERIIRIEGNYYILKAEDSTGFRDFVGFFIVSQLFYVETLMILATIFVSGAILLRQYVNPIIRLSEQMNDYERASIIPPPPRVRKDELGFLQQQFISFIKTIQTEKQKQNQLIASISHDIKTPLTSIMGYVERLAMKDLDEEKRRHYLQIIYSKAQHMNEIVNEFDEYISYNMENSLTLRPFDLKTIERLIVQEFGAELEDIHVRFDVVNECSEEVVSIDILKFERVIGNLISNSIKHITDDPYIRIRLSPEKNGVQLVFEDNGTGVDPQDLPYIFDPLFTTDKSRKVAGLGLSICKNIIHSHNGAIQAFNKPEGGLAIHIWMPTTH